jgi:hypothetical protein
VSGECPTELFKLAIRKKLFAKQEGFFCAPVWLQARQHLFYGGYLSQQHHWLPEVVISVQLNCSNWHSAIKLCRLRCAPVRLQARQHLFYGGCLSQQHLQMVVGGISVQLNCSKWHNAIKL